MRRATIAAMLGMLAGPPGCGTLEGASDVYAARFVGSHVNEVIAALGAPGTREIGPSGEVLSWEFSAPLELRSPVYERRAGLLVISGYETETRLELCLYEVSAGADGIVTAQRLEGSASLCLSRLAD